MKKIRFNIADQTVGFMKNTKEHILQTSLLLFLQKSYKDVTMKEIVIETGLSKGAFYHYFTSKEELFREIAMLFFNMGTMNYSMFPQNSLKNFIDTYLSTTEKSFIEINQLLGGDKNKGVSFNFFFIMFDAMKMFPDMMKLEEEIYLKDLKIWESVIDTAKQTGEINTITPSQDVANLFLYCTDGVFIRVLNTEKQVNYTDKLKEAFYSVYNNLK